MVLIPGLSISAFNGQENDNEIDQVNGANTTAEFWEYDSRLGRRWNMDPNQGGGAGPTNNGSETIQTPNAGNANTTVTVDHGAIVVTAPGKHKPSASGDPSMGNMPDPHNPKNNGPHGNEYHQGDKIDVFYKNKKVGTLTVEEFGTYEEKGDLGETHREVWIHLIFHEKKESGLKDFAWIQTWTSNRVKSWLGQVPDGIYPDDQDNNSTPDRDRDKHTVPYYGGMSGLQDCS